MAITLLHLALSCSLFFVLLYDCLHLVSLMILTHTEFLLSFAFFNCFFVLLIGLHLVFRNDSLVSWFKVKIDQIKKKQLYVWQTPNSERRLWLHFQHRSFCLKLGAPHYFEKEQWSVLFHISNLGRGRSQQPMLSFLLSFRWTMSEDLVYTDI